MGDRASATRRSRSPRRSSRPRPQAFTNQQLIGEYYAPRDPVKTAAAYEAYLANRPTELEGGDVLPRIRLGLRVPRERARRARRRRRAARERRSTRRRSISSSTSQRKLGKKPNAQVNADNGLCAAYTGLGRWDQAITVCERVVAGSEAHRCDRLGLVQPRDRVPRAQADEEGAHRRERVHARAQDRGARLHPDRRHLLRRPRLGQRARPVPAAPRSCCKPNQAREQVQLSIRLGKTYRRLPAPASRPEPEPRARDRQADRPRSARTRAASSSRSSSAARTSRRGRTPRRPR